jgi:ubiquinone/menaquinone biosynthesis C-methylase UbiE
LTSLGDIRPKSSYSENADFWVKIIRERLDRYRSELTDRAVLEAIGPTDGLTVLDAGCGEGYLSRILAQDGAETIGIDACPDLIKSAQELATDAGLAIDYHVGTVDDLPIRDGQCDVVVCNHVLNDLQDIATPFREFARVIREGGRIVILMLHPCFYSANAERSVNHRYPTPDEYFHLRTIEQQFKVAGITSPAKVVMWFRPLEDYILQLHESGLYITSLSEPHPSADQLVADSWWHANFVRPLFMLIVATKGHKAD